MAIYIGIDQALRKIGLCVLEQGVPHVLHLIKTPATLRGTHRLCFLRDSLRQQLQPYATRITHAALEAQSFRSLGDIDQLGHIIGITQIVLADVGVAQPLLIPPATLKKFVSGSARAKKMHMIATTQQYWGLHIPQDDVCDAHGLARIAEEFVEQKSRLRHQVEALRWLREPHKKIRKRSTLSPHI